MHYFKFHHEAMTDAKVQTLAPEMFRAWVNLLCMASANVPRGTIPPMKQVAYILHVPVDEAARIVNGLVADGLIDTIEGAFRPHNWDARQGRVDLSTERSRRYRRRVKEKVKAASPTPPQPPDPGGKPDATVTQRVANRDATFHATVANGSATPPEENRREEKRKEEEMIPNVIISPYRHDDDGDLGCDDEDYKEAARRLGYQVVCRGHRDTIEHTRAVFGDKCAVVVGNRGMHINQHLGGRWELFRAAVDTMKRTGKGKSDFYGYAIVLAKEYRSTGIPLAPVATPDDPDIIRPRVFPARDYASPKQQRDQETHSAYAESFRRLGLKESS